MANPAGAVIWYCNGAEPPVVDVIVTFEVFAGQLNADGLNVKSVGGVKGAIVTGNVTNVQLFTSLIVIV
ncbi:hypothetical protein D3C84_1145780 [compost metagenome]